VTATEMVYVAEADELMEADVGFQKGRQLTSKSCERLAEHGLAPAGATRECHGLNGLRSRHFALVGDFGSFSSGKIKSMCNACLAKKRKRSGSVMCQFVNAWSRSAPRWRVPTPNMPTRLCMMSSVPRLSGTSSSTTSWRCRCSLSCLRRHRCLSLGRRSINSEEHVGPIGDEMTFEEVDNLLTDERVPESLKALLRLSDVMLVESELARAEAILGWMLSESSLCEHYNAVPAAFVTLSCRECSRTSRTSPRCTPVLHAQVERSLDGHLSLRVGARLGVRRCAQDDERQLAIARPSRPPRPACCSAACRPAPVISSTSRTCCWSMPRPKESRVAQTRSSSSPMYAA
jgi:hypothetical protein